MYYANYFYCYSATRLRLWRPSYPTFPRKTPKRDIWLIWDWISLLYERVELLLQEASYRVRGRVFVTEKEPETKAEEEEATE